MLEPTQIAAGQPMDTTSISSIRYYPTRPEAAWLTQQKLLLDLTWNALLRRIVDDAMDREEQ
jgi:hypothetical protein